MLFLSIPTNCWQKPNPLSLFWQWEFLMLLWVVWYQYGDSLSGILVLFVIRRQVKYFVGLNGVTEACKGLTTWRKSAWEHHDEMTSLSASLSARVQIQPKNCWCATSVSGRRTDQDNIGPGCILVTFPNTTPQRWELFPIRRNNVQSFLTVKPKKMVQMTKLQKHSVHISVGK